MTRPFFGKNADVSAFFADYISPVVWTLKTQNFNIMFILWVLYCDVNVRQIPDTLVSPSGWFDVELPLVKSYALFFDMLDSVSGVACPGIQSMQISS